MAIVRYDTHSVPYLSKCWKFPFRSNMSWELRCEIMEWIKETLDGDVFIKQGWMYFPNKEEAAIFKLRWA